MFTVGKEQYELKNSLEKAVVTGLFYYPIKSCQGWAIEEAQLTQRGLLHDREFMVVEPSGELVTQREIAKMALIAPQVNGDRLQVNAPGMPTLDIPIVQESVMRPATVWGHTCRSVDQGAEATKWFSEFLGLEVGLVRMANDYVRKVNPDYSLHENDQTGFADGYPCLIISEESLTDLNSRLATPLPMNRFRPNIVIKGSGVAFGEDLLKKFQLGAVNFFAVKPCGRCTITTTDQVTTERGKEPLKTLAAYRKARKDGQVLFGQNLLHDQTGTLKIGLPVIVHELQEPPALV